MPRPRSTRRAGRTPVAGLHFGHRARRRARARRMATWAGLVSTAAILLGVPGSDVGIRAVEHFAGRSDLLPARDGVEATESAASVMHFRTRVFETRPAPRDDHSESEGADTGPGSVTELIYAAGAEFDVDGDYLLSIAGCESGLDPYAHNPAGYYGLFQFDEGTWAAYGYGSIFDPEAQARTAARLLAAGQAARWPNCP